MTNVRDIIDLFFEKKTILVFRSQIFMKTSFCHFVLIKIYDRNINMICLFSIFFDFE